MARLSIDTRYLLSVDPGLSTGVAFLSYTDDTSPVLEGAWQFPGGVSGLLGWLKIHHREAWYDSEWGEDYAASIRPDYAASIRPDPDVWKLYTLADEGNYGYPSGEDDDEDAEPEWVVSRPQEVTTISEKFNARNTKGYSYTTASLEPLRCEGVLIAKGLMPDYTTKEKRWVDPKYQYLVGGKDLPDKKKRQHKFLKDSGFYRTGKDLGAPDADDFRSSASHGLAYLLRGGHTPTLNLVRDWIDINES